MAKAIRIHKYGGPEVMSYEDVPTPQPKAGEVLIRQSAIGLNFIDVYHRTGLYPAASMPFTPGSEGAVRDTLTVRQSGLREVNEGGRGVYGEYEAWNLYKAAHLLAGRALPNNPNPPLPQF